MYVKWSESEAIRGFHLLTWITLKWEQTLQNLQHFVLFVNMQAAFRVRIYPFVKNDDKPFIFLIFLHLDELGLFVLLRCLKKTENYSHPLKQSWLMVPDCKRFSHLQFVALPVLTSRVGGGKLVVATRQIKRFWIFGSGRKSCQLCQTHWQ